MPASVTSVSASNANGAYKAGAVINLTVSFDMAVTVTGAPQLTLNTGGVAQYLSGSGTSDLTFAYTVQAGHNTADLDYIGTGALNLNGGTAISADSFAAILSLATPGAAGSLGANKSLVIDTAAPTVAITSNTAMLYSGQTATITFAFSEAPVGFDAGDISVAGGTLSGMGATGNPLVYTATFTPTGAVSAGVASITVTSGGYTDVAGNAGGAGASPSLSFNTAGPGLTITSSAGMLKAGESANIFFTFSSAPVGFTAGDITVSGGTLSGLNATANPLVYTASFTPSAGVNAGVGSITVAGGAYSDTLGNPGAPGLSPSLSFDTWAPSVLISSDKAALAAGQSATMTFTFSEAPTGFSLGDLIAMNGTLSGFTLTANPAIYTATFTPTAGLSGATGGVVLAANLYADAAGNPGLGASLSGISINTTGPTATIALADSALTRGETTLVTVTFNEAVTGFDNSDLSAANGTLSPVVSTDGGMTWTATFTPTANIADASNVIVLNNTGVTNAAGDAGAGTTSSANYTIDTRPPPEPEPEPSVVVVVTPGGNQVTGDAENNLISPSGGADTVWAGGGFDTVLGGDKSDLLQGNAGADSIAAGGGADLVYGGQGGDILQGNAGNDMLFGDLGDDTVVGGQGADLVQGGQGDDYVSGDLGDDVVRGGQGDDRVFGGAGNDHLSGDLGSDTLTGGTGADIFHSFGGAGLDLVTDFNRAEGDLVVLDPGTTYVLTQIGADLHIVMGGGGEMVLAGVQLSSLGSGWIVA